MKAKIFRCPERWRQHRDSEVAARPADKTGSRQMDIRIVVLVRIVRHLWVGVVAQCDLASQNFAEVVEVVVTVVAVLAEVLLNIQFAADYRAVHLEKLFPVD